MKLITSVSVTEQSMLNYGEITVGPDQTVIINALTAYNVELVATNKKLGIKVICRSALPNSKWYLEENAIFLLVCEFCALLLHFDRENGQKRQLCHYRSLFPSQITNITIVYSTVYSVADQRKHQSSASLAFVRGIHRWPVNSPHKGPVTQKMFPFDGVIMILGYLLYSLVYVIRVYYRYLKTRDSPTVWCLCALVPTLP